MSIYQKLDSESSLEYKKNKFQKRVEVILYPIPQTTGKNERYQYESMLRDACDRYVKSLKGRYNQTRMSERYERCPEGYRCKMYFYTITTKAKAKTNDERVWINLLDL